MTTAPLLIGNGVTPLRTTDQTTTSDGLVVASGGGDTNSDDVDDSDFSVAGEEDPGASLDGIGPGTSEPEARWCPWPRQAFT